MMHQSTTFRCAQTMLMKFNRYSAHMATSVLLLAIVFAATSTQAVAQSGFDNRTKYGLFLHGAYNMHSADFIALPNVPCCSPGWSSGSGFGFDVGLLATLPLADQWNLSLRAGFSSLNGNLETEEQRTVSLFGEAVNGTFVHSLDASIPAVTIDVLAGFRPIDKLTIMLGPSAALLMSPSFEQSETIEAPDQGTFENGERTRLNASGDIPNAKSFMPMLTFGLSYDIPLDEKHTWYIIPEAMFSLGLGDVADSPWTVNRLRFGVAVAYSPADERMPSSTARQYKPIGATIAASGLDSNGTERQRVTIRVEEFLSTRMKPILPYVFFDDGSSVLPARYKRRNEASVASFRELDLHDASMIETYHDLLNIIGRRMQEYPNSTITITGTNSGKGADGASSAVAKARAEEVKKYIVSAWRIAPTRISTDSRALPSVPSNVAEQDGTDENRRAEITTDEPRLLDPVWTTDTSRSVNPPGIRFRNTVTAGAGVEEWRINVSQDGQAVKTFSDSGEVPTIVDWDVENDQQFVPRAPSALDYTIYIKDTDGQEHVAKGVPLNVEQITIQKKRRERIKDKEVDRYALIAFAYSDATVTSQQARLLDRIKERVSLASNIVISGHTDRTGDTAFNQKLSVDRAKNVATYLRGGSMSANGYGEVDAPYDNNLPEGRFYNRTVNIVVENPLKE